MRIRKPVYFGGIFGFELIPSRKNWKWFKYSWRDIYYNPHASKGHPRCALNRPSSHLEIGPITLCVVWDYLEGEREIPNG